MAKLKLRYRLRRLRFILVRQLIKTQFDDATVKRNYRINIADGAMFSFAMALVSQQTVIPVFIKSVGGSSIAIGMIPVIWTIGFNFPQILIANYASNQPYKKPLLLITGIFQRLFWLALAIASFYLVDTIPVGFSVTIVFILLALAAIGGGLNFPGWFDLISKITPTNLRGRLFAWRVAIGALLGFAGGYTVKYVLDKMFYPYNYSMLFIIAFLVTMISYSLLFFIKEDTPNKPANKLGYKEYLKLIPVIIKKNKNFRNFLIADVTMIMAFTSFAFFTVDAINKFSLPDSIAGEFTMIMMVSMVFGSLIFGHLADLHGHKNNLLYMSLFTLAACLIALIAVNVYFYYLVFVFAALATAMIQVSRITLVAEMCNDEERAIYAAITNIVTVPFILTGILAGWLAYYLKYNSVFIICIFISALAAYWYKYKVIEPRSIKVSPLL
jgi:MFS family permease